MGDARTVRYFTEPAIPWLAGAVMDWELIRYFTEHELMRMAGAAKGEHGANKIFYGEALL